MPEPRVNLLDPTTGRIFNAPASQVGRAEQLGYKVATPEHVQADKLEEEVSNFRGAAAGVGMGIGASVADPVAGVTGIAAKLSGYDIRTPTFAEMVSKVGDVDMAKLRAIHEYQSGAVAAGEVAGALAQAAATGGGSALAKYGLPANLLTEGSEYLTKKLAARLGTGPVAGAISHALPSAAEAGFWGSGMAARDAALHETELTGEMMIGGFAGGALVGGLFGGAIGGVKGALGSGASRGQAIMQEALAKAPNKEAAIEALQRLPSMDKATAVETYSRWASVFSNANKEEIFLFNPLREKGHIPKAGKLTPEREELAKAFSGAELLERVRKSEERSLEIQGQHYKLSEFLDKSANVQLRWQRQGLKESQVADMIEVEVSKSGNELVPMKVVSGYHADSGYIASELKRLLRSNTVGKELRLRKAAQEFADMHNEVRQHLGFKPIEFKAMKPSEMMDAIMNDNLTPTNLWHERGRTAKVYIAQDKMKARMHSHVKKLRSEVARIGEEGAPKSAELAPELEKLYTRMRGSLEDSGTWGGKLSRRQKKLNEGFAKVIAAEHNLARGGMFRLVEDGLSPGRTRLVASDSGWRGFVRTDVGDINSLRYKETVKYLEAMAEFALETGDDDLAREVAAMSKEIISDIRELHVDKVISKGWDSLGGGGQNLANYVGFAAGDIVRPKGVGMWLPALTAAAAKYATSPKQLYEVAMDNPRAFRMITEFHRVRQAANDMTDNSVAKSVGGKLLPMGKDAATGIWGNTKAALKFAARNNNKYRLPIMDFARERIFGEEQEKLEDEMIAARELRDDPAQLDDMIAAWFADGEGPGLQVAMYAHKTAEAALDYLLVKNPVQERMNAYLLEPPEVPSISETQRHLRRSKVAKNPRTMFDAWKSNQLDDDMVNTFKAIYPKWYEQTSTRVLMAVAQAQAMGMEVPYPNRLQLGVLLQSKTDGMLSAKFMGEMRSFYSKTLKKQESRKKRRGGNQPQLSEAFYYEAGSQRVGKDDGNT